MASSAPATDGCSEREGFFARGKTREAIRLKSGELAKAAFKCSTTQARVEPVGASARVPSEVVKRKTRNRGARRRRINPIPFETRQEKSKSINSFLICAKHSLRRRLRDLGGSEPASSDWGVKER